MNKKMREIQAQILAKQEQAKGLIEGETKDFAVWLGGTEADGTVTPTGSDGKFEFKGQLAVYVNGGGVNEVVNMTVSIAASTPITLGADA